jgi:hypothetical protein
MCGSRPTGLLRSANEVGQRLDRAMRLERVSIDVTNRCSKVCRFCYARSRADGLTLWSLRELIDFARDCAMNSVRAISFGGGEPLECPWLCEVLEELRGLAFRSVTTNGLPLSKEMMDRLASVQPDKIHVSIHFPEDEAEVRRVIRQVHELADRGIRSGINLLVAHSRAGAAARAAQEIRASGIGNDRIVYLALRGSDTPTAAQLFAVAGKRPFQSASCLAGCAASQRFCSVSWDRAVAWCSHTSSRRLMAELSYRGLVEALNSLDLLHCGATDEP